MDELRVSNLALDSSQFLIAIPEPSTYALVGVALLGFGLARRR